MHPNAICLAGVRDSAGAGDGPPPPSPAHHACRVDTHLSHCHSEPPQGGEESLRPSTFRPSGTAHPPRALRRRALGIPTCSYSRAVHLPSSPGRRPHPFGCAEGRGAPSPGYTRPWRPVPWGHPKGCGGRRGVEGETEWRGGARGCRCRCRPARGARNESKGWTVPVWRHRARLTAFAAVFPRQPEHPQV